MRARVQVSPGPPNHSKLKANDSNQDVFINTHILETRITLCNRWRAMIEDLELLLVIAEITGIFVGFGVLISISRPKDADDWQISQIRAVVSVGLMVFVVALLPVILNRYGVEGHPLWLVCSLIFLVLNWGGVIQVFRSPGSRSLAVIQARDQPLRTMFFFFLEVLMQAPLYLILLGLYPDFDPAFYTTSLLFNLFQGVYMLAQVVHGDGLSSDSDQTPHVIND